MIVLLFLSILFAGWWTRHSLALFAYFCAQFVGTLAAVVVHYACGDDSLAYGATYIVLTAAILFSVVNMARLCIGRNHARICAIATILSVTLTRMAYLALGHSPMWYDWIGLIEGGVLFWSGLIVGFASPFQQRTGIHLSFGLLFLAQTGWRWGFYIHMPGWNDLNWIVSPSIPILAFTVIGLLARHEEMKETNRLRLELLWRAHR